jgi:hypothetical protein
MKVNMDALFGVAGGGVGNGGFRNGGVGNGGQDGGRPGSGQDDRCAHGPAGLKILAQ